MIHAALFTLLMFAAVSAPDSVPADPCAARRPAARTSVEAFVIVPSVRPSDTVVTAAVCVVPPKSSPTKVGSYHGELYFDSTAAKVLRVEKQPSGGGMGGMGGMRVENTRLPGQVNFAGAAPSGFAAGVVLRVVLRLRKPGTPPRLRLKMLELNAADGSSLMKQLVTSSLP